MNYVVNKNRNKTNIIILIIVILLLITVPYYAYSETQNGKKKYIVNKDGKVMATISCEPNLEDLNSRGEFVVESSEDIDLSEAEYKDKKIQRKKVNKIDREKNIEKKAEKIVELLKEAGYKIERIEK